MEGKIIKGIAGFYYVHTKTNKIYECKAKGVFRKNKIKPLVGDNVIIDILDEKEEKGNIISVLERQNELVRPAVANIDQALVIFAVAKPNPNFNLLDRFLIMMEKQNVKTIICFNKKDIATQKELELLKDTYIRCGYHIVFTSAKFEDGMEKIRELIKGRTTAVAGPSGVGKSSLINVLQPKALMETGAISEKIDRGKHTTRHSELIWIEENTYIMDTPGFSSLYIDDLEKEELKDYFPEFIEYQDGCKFQGCMHVNEPKCMVKHALDEGKISQIRYNNYVEMFHELKDKRRY
ncbi:ribosome small subunit-dependent GTPase A [Candidatus Galacturonibacter soehngenii]|uniref:Small ribosomal subunit biogenesis GTPase RsgA n=1 Tax=Candidatus Galacturonatibacter soehngenii TaxID=2307010 RepID=A0A7V7QNV0_9FIRM|nr:ribosome small subunit-dependent GTPase A [Candidatus Galacturonibacter soehngenii]KAB1440714.1 ribosome small subunit-dependent GTPase A [Candidatus Galacturonibacter soehngenii]MBA4687474.1 ribosome small subunit-dependent GTPase A [Candidatus Galacturonibacter soehngenii]